MASLLDDVCCACLPADALGRLATLRTHAGIRVRLAGDRVWLWWTAGDTAVLERVLALHGAEVFAPHGDRWYRPGQHLPAFEVPAESETRPLVQVLTPDFVRAESGQPRVDSVALGLVRDDQPRAAAALCCHLSDLAGWAERATSKQLAALEAIHAGESVLLRGSRLPPLAAGQRYWGRAILIPLGFRFRLDLSEGVLREALRLQAHEIALFCSPLPCTQGRGVGGEGWLSLPLTPTPLPRCSGGEGPNEQALSDVGFEVIEGHLFQPLTRAGVRLAVREKS
jgi:hypothetical protein